MGKTRFSPAVVPVLVLFLAAGCAGRNLFQDTIRVANFLTDVKLLQICNDIARDIEKNNPGLTIRIENIPYNQYQQKISTQLAAKNAPDVIFVEVNNFVDLYTRGVFEDLTPYIQADHVDLKAYYPDVVGRFTRDGKAYALPQDTAPSGLMYFNKNVFDEMGVPYPTDDWSWPEPFLSICKKLVKRDDKGNTVHWAYSDAYGVGFDNFLFSAGGDYVDDDANPTKLTLDSPQAIQAARFRWDLIHTHHVSPSMDAIQTFTMGSSIADMFANGRVAMMSSGIWQTPRLLADEKLKFDVVMFPKGPGGKRGWTTGGSGYAICSASKKKALAWKVVKELTSERAQRLLAETGFIQPALVKLAGSDAFLKAPGAPNKKILLKMPAHAHYQPFMAQWPELFYGNFGPAMDPVWLGTRKPEEVLPRITAELNKKFFPKK
jgi:ABC-type glycerol-3-phosphate transport system substrate-binding protein